MTAIEETIVDLQRTNAKLLRELEAARAQRNSEYRERIAHQSATIDMLKEMSASPADPQPFFEKIVRRVTDLCDAQGAGLWKLDGGLVHLCAYHFSNINQPALAAYTSLFPMVPTRETLVGQAILDKQIIHVRDVGEENGLMPATQNIDSRSHLMLPLLRDGVAIGAIGLNSLARGGFTDNQVELVRTFTEQTVIAIGAAETYRKLKQRTDDLQEALESQTATSDVLKIISRSAFDLTAVLQTVVASAVNLCGAERAILYRYREGACHFEVGHNNTPEYERLERAMPIVSGQDTLVGRTIAEGKTVQIDDALNDPDYSPKDEAKTGNVRSMLGVPLLRDGELIGVFALARTVVAPFSVRQVELVTTFADQALIAMENARLINEQREALEQQTAAAEVLQVINASAGDLAPVFDAVLERALRLCGASFGTLLTYDGESIERVASFCVPPAFIEYTRRNPLTKNAALILRGIETGKPVQAADVMTDALLSATPSARDAFVELGGVHALLLVPLLKDEVVIGFITIFRQEPGIFPDKQVALLEGFAAQAVIAMENARLLRELQERTAALAHRNSEYDERIEQQSATIDVLKVMANSPGDAGPVFDLIAQRARAFCEADGATMALVNGEMLHLQTHVGMTGERARAFARAYEASFPQPIGASTMFGRAILARDVVQTRDVAEDQEHFTNRFSGKEMHSIVAVPMLREGVPIGAIAIARRTPGGFSETQVSLMKTFAEQAVIAVSSAETFRKLNERTADLQEALEQQTATAEVLQMINASPGDLAPVFDTMLEKAMQLCGAAFGSLYTYDGERFHSATQRGVPDAYAEFRAKNPPMLGSGSLMAQLLETKRPLHILDVMAEEPYRAGFPNARAMVDLGGMRTVIAIPLLKEEAVLGYIAIYRSEVLAFSDKQIALLQSFAAYAVIAMESARLLHELRARTDELSHRQAELRVTFENMGDGVAMFDETRHLVAWNSRFQAVLDLPDGPLAERLTFPEYIRYLTERGEFGAGADPEEQIRRLMDHANEHHAYERTRPDGRVIEVRHNPVPGGGFVLIYADITERKRNEAEIRAARDAAEEASRTIEAAYRDLKAAQANLIQAEKMASLGQLTAGIAHEIKNPLNFVNNFSDLSVELLDELNAAVAPDKLLVDNDLRAEINELTATLKDNLAKIAQHGRRADSIVRNMLLHSRSGPSEHRAVDLNATVEETLNLAYHGARAETPEFNITMKKSLDPAAGAVDMYPQEITRVILNLINNGLYAARKRADKCAEPGFDPTLWVTTRNLHDQVEIRVRDNGTGIPEESRNKIFEPFFTTKPAGEGTGLGLSLSFDIVVKQHGGQLTVDSQVDGFTEFTVTLPRVMAATTKAGRA